MDVRRAMLAALVMEATGVATLALGRPQTSLTLAIASLLMSVGLALLALAALARRWSAESAARDIARPAPSAPVGTTSGAGTRSDRAALAG